jgi:hypothetical protein
VGLFLRVCLGSSCKSFFSFSFFNKTPYYLSKKKKCKAAISTFMVFLQSRSNTASCIVLGLQIADRREVNMERNEI